MKRICKKCGVEKEVEEFTKDKKCLYGRTWTCEKCTIDLRKEQNKKNKNLRKEYYKKNKDRIRVVRKEYLEKNKDSISLRCKEYNKKHKNQIALNAKAYYKKHKNKMNAVGKKRREENRSEVIIYRKKYKQTHKAKLKADNLKRSKFLYDGYVRGLICSKGKAELNDITPEMMELKRIQLKLYREIKKGKGILNEIYSDV